jgi:putative nucleotidyltransferase with HDIG domain
MASVSAAQSRERQLDVIAAILVVALLITLGLLVYFMTIAGFKLPGVTPVEDYFVRTLLVGLVLCLLLYIADQRRRLQHKIAAAVKDTEAARGKLITAVEWLTFSHESASVLAAEGIEKGLTEVLKGAAGLHKADAAAVMGEDMDFLYVADEALRDTAETALLHVAVQCVGKPNPMLIESLGETEGCALAVPLRVHDELRYVLALWSDARTFDAGQLSSLGLMGRMVELAIEREELLGEAQDQLEGTLNVLQYLVCDKRPDYSQHALRVASLASDLAADLGMSAAQRRSLKLAGLIHDVGIMTMPNDIADASAPLSHEERLIVQQHPRIGAEIAEVAHFDHAVQEAVAGHHERIDGSGYPRRMHGEQIPMSARILAACEVFDSMTHRTYHGEMTTLEEALDELRDNAGTLYDKRVVEVLVARHEGDGQVIAPTLTPVELEL